jgi:phosphonate transport system permease protein
MQRGLRFLGLALFLVWSIGTLWYFDFSPARLWNGLSGLGKIIVLMIPPSPGELWVEIMKGMARSSRAFASPSGEKAREWKPDSSL